MTTTLKFKSSAYGNYVIMQTDDACSVHPSFDAKAINAFEFIYGGYYFQVDNFEELIFTLGIIKQEGLKSGVQFAIEKGFFEAILAAFEVREQDAPDLKTLIQSFVANSVKQEVKSSAIQEVEPTTAQEAKDSKENKPESNTNKLSLNTLCAYSEDDEVYASAENVLELVSSLVSLGSDEHLQKADQVRIAAALAKIQNNIFTIYGSAPLPDTLLRAIYSVYANYLTQTGQFEDAVKLLAKIDLAHVTPEYAARIGVECYSWLQQFEVDTAINYNEEKEDVASVTKPRQAVLEFTIRALSIASRDAFDSDSFRLLQYTLLQHRLLVGSLDSSEASTASSEKAGSTGNMLAFSYDSEFYHQWLLKLSQNLLLIDKRQEFVLNPFFVTLILNAATIYNLPLHVVIKIFVNTSNPQVASVAFDMIFSAFFLDQLEESKPHPDAPTAVDRTIQELVIEESKETERIARNEGKVTPNHIKKKIITGIALERGFVTKPNPEAAFACFQGVERFDLDEDPKLVEARRYSKFMQGYCLETGIGTIQNQEAAEELYFAARRLAIAEYHIGKSYRGFIGIASRLRAASFYNGAATEGLPAAQYQLAMCDEKHSALFYTAATHLHPLAMYQIGVRIKDGKDAPQEGMTAVTWFERAAARNCVSAMCMLGDIRLGGLLGVTKDAKIAIEHFTAAAHLGDSDALYKLAGFYFDGATAVTKDIEFAIRLCALAAVKGKAEAYLRLDMISTDRGFDPYMLCTITALLYVFAKTAKLSIRQEARAVLVFLKKLLLQEKGNLSKVLSVDYATALCFAGLVDLSDTHVLDTAVDYVRAERVIDIGTTFPLHLPVGEIILQVVSDIIEQNLLLKVESAVFHNTFHAVVSELFFYCLKNHSSAEAQCQLEILDENYLSPEQNLQFAKRLLVLNDKSYEVRVVRHLNAAARSGNAQALTLLAQMVGQDVKSLPDNLTYNGWIHALVMKRYLIEGQYLYSILNFATLTNLPLDLLFKIFIELEDLRLEDLVFHTIMLRVYELNEDNTELGNLERELLTSLELKAVEEKDAKASANSNQLIARQAKIHIILGIIAEKSLNSSRPYTAYERFNRANLLGSILRYSQYLLGYYFEGTRKKDVRDIQVYYQNAAAQGLSIARLKHGVDPKVNYEAEIKSYTAAAELGNPYAQSLLGLFFDLKGKAVTSSLASKSFKTAVCWLTQATKQKYPFAFNKLAEFYLIGRPDLPEDLYLVSTLLKAASKLNNATAQYLLGIFFRTGLARSEQCYIVPQDFSMAMRLFARAAVGGHGWAFQELELFSINSLNALAYTKALLYVFLVSQDIAITQRAFQKIWDFDAALQVGLPIAANNVEMEEKARIQAKINEAAYSIAIITGKVNFNDDNCVKWLKDNILFPPPTLAGRRVIPEFSIDAAVSVALQQRFSELVASPSFRRAVSDKFHKFLYEVGLAFINKGSNDLALKYLSKLDSRYLTAEQNRKIGIIFVNMHRQDALKYLFAAGAFDFETRSLLKQLLATLSLRQQEEAIRYLHAASTSDSKALSLLVQLAAFVPLGLLFEIFIGANEPDASILFDEIIRRIPEDEEVLSGDAQREFKIFTQRFADLVKESSVRSKLILHCETAGQNRKIGAIFAKVNRQLDAIRGVHTVRAYDFAVMPLRRLFEIFISEGEPYACLAFNEIIRRISTNGIVLNDDDQCELMAFMFDNYRSVSRKQKIADVIMVAVYGVKAPSYHLPMICGTLMLTKALLIDLLVIHSAHRAVDDELAGLKVYSTYLQAFCYERGIVVPTDKPYSIALYKSAAKADVNDAYRQLVVYFDGSGKKNVVLILIVLISFLTIIPFLIWGMIDRARFNGENANQRNSLTSGSLNVAIETRLPSWLHFLHWFNPASWHPRIMRNNSNYRALKLLYELFLDKFNLIDTLFFASAILVITFVGLLNYWVLPIVIWWSFLRTLAIIVQARYDYLGVVQEGKVASWNSIRPVVLKTLCFAVTPLILVSLAVLSAVSNIGFVAEVVVVNGFALVSGFGMFFGLGVLLGACLEIALRFFVKSEINQNIYRGYILFSFGGLGLAALAIGLGLLLLFSNPVGSLATIAMVLATICIGACISAAVNYCNSINNTAELLAPAHHTGEMAAASSSGASMEHASAQSADMAPSVSSGPTVSLAVSTLASSSYVASASGLSDSGGSGAESSRSVIAPSVAEWGVTANFFQANNPSATFASSFAAQTSASTSSAAPAVAIVV